MVTYCRGNTTHRDYFKLLREDSGSVLVGARNIIYNLSLPDLSEHVDEVELAVVVYNATIVTSVVFQDVR